MKNPLEKNITARLIFSFSLLILTFIFFNLAALYDIRTISGLTKTIYNHPLAVSNAALASNASIAKMHRSMKDVVLFKDADRIAAAIEDVAREEEKVYRNLDIVKDRILGDRGKQFEHEARLLFEEWLPIREHVIALVLNNQRQKAAEITRGKGQPMWHVSKKKCSVSHATPGKKPRTLWQHQARHRPGYSSPPSGS